VKTYTIKPLVWKGNDMQAYSYCKLFGDISVFKTWLGYECNRAGVRACDTIEAAKLAAEGWYREQIEQALEQVT
jgi:hypothetical protein